MVAVGDTDTDPLVPDAVKLVPVQDVAFVLLHVRLVALPEVTEVGDAESTTVGSTGDWTAKVMDALPDVLPAVSWHFT